MNRKQRVKGTHSETALHGDGKVELSSRVQPLSDHHFLANAAIFACLLGEQLVIQHLSCNVLSLFCPGNKNAGQHKLNL